MENQEALPEFTVITNAEDKRPLQTLMWGFDIGVRQGRVGIMQAFDKEQNKEELLLVGLEVAADGGLSCFPLAIVLTDADASRYLAPNGEGGWLQPEAENGTE